MSWLLRSPRRREVKEAGSGSEVVFGLEFVVKRVGGDLVVYGRARTRGDLERLRRITDEAFSEILEHEGKRHRPAGSRRS